MSRERARCAEARVRSRSKERATKGGRAPEDGWGGGSSGGGGGRVGTRTPLSLRRAIMFCGIQRSAQQHPVRSHLFTPSMWELEEQMRENTIDQARGWIQVGQATYVELVLELTELLFSQAVGVL